jgi:hypothetical protein
LVVGLLEQRDQLRAVTWRPSPQSMFLSR